MGKSIRLLWVATKAPWPTVDGGRLLLWNTLAGLRRAGVEVTLVAPYLGAGARREDVEERLREVCRPRLVPSRLRSGVVDVARSLLRRRPWTLIRHENENVLRRVAEELADGGQRAVIAEQVQALAQIPAPRKGDGPDGAGESGPPVVLRAENVESDLWSSLAREERLAPLRVWLGRQASALAAAEGRAVARCRLTAALTEFDAERLRTLGRTSALSSALTAARSPGRTLDSRVEVVPAAVDGELPAGPPLDGEPAVVLFGSAGWKPNVEGARHFVEEAWPAVRRRSPGAVLHVFGEALSAPNASSGVRCHPAPEESRRALARGSVLVVPLRVASGVRMKILEAWARGVAVVASPTAARGLEMDPGRELLVADGPDAWAAAVAEAAERYDDLTGAARARLASTYAPEAVSRRWLHLLDELDRGTTTDPR